MEITWQGLVYILEVFWILTVLFFMREFIESKIYGIRYKRWQEIDTGRYGYVILDKGLTSCTINGMKKSICRANIKSGILYFVSDVAENLKVENATEKYQAYMNSEEFNTVYQNKLLTTLMLSLQNNYLLIILILAGASLALGLYNLYNADTETAKLNYIMWKVNQTYVGN